MSRSCTDALESLWNVWKRMKRAFAGVVNESTVAVPAVTDASGLAVSNVHAGVTVHRVVELRRDLDAADRSARRLPAKPDCTL